MTEISQQSEHIATWFSRTTISRRELSHLSDRTLRDIGILRGDKHREFPKPFWAA
jgi:uncharacterized protein YjiS (DUF1127 family)